MNTTSLAVFATVFMLHGMNPSFAQAGSEEPLVQELQIKSKALNEERVITVSLPDDYNTTENTYPVLYLLDGRTHLQHATGAVSFLAAQGSIPRMIVISIHNVDRTRDFSPAHDESIPTSGGGDKFLEFLSNELSPFLEKRFRISEFSMLMGHSFGGTFAAYALYTDPGLFDAYIAVSPYLHFKENYVIKEAEKLIKPNKNAISFYLTVGDEPAYFEPIREFSAIMDEKTDGTVDYHVEKMLSENHATIPYISVYKGLKFIFSEWPVPQETFQSGLEAIDKHIAKNSARYGINVRASEVMINQLGYYHLQNNEIDKAIHVFSENVKRFPTSANVYDSLGEAYENNNQLKLAREHYQKAVDIGSVTSDPNYPIYIQNLKRVTEELE
jgi:predicted alpha/beta superfamily hydrolase